MTENVNSRIKIFKIQSHKYFKYHKGVLGFWGFGVLGQVNF